MTDQTKITGGKVAYGQTICPKQYESKRADVELTFSVAEGDDYAAIFDTASTAAIRRVAQLLFEQMKQPGSTAEKVAVDLRSKPTSTTEGLFGA